MVEDNFGQVGNSLEEAWGNLVEEYFSGDNVPALQIHKIQITEYFLLGQKW